jgi:hypothetical protein
MDVGTAKIKRTARTALTHDVTSNNTARRSTRAGRQEAKNYRRTNKMPMRDREDLIDIDIPSVQKAMVKVMYDAYEDCRDLNCVSCPDRRKSANNCMRSCILFKYARKLYEAGFVYAEEDVWSAYNDGYACGMEQGIEAERSRKG